MSILNYNNWCKVKGKEKRIFYCACRPLLPFWVHMDPCIEQVSSAKSLGVYIDQTLLNLECQINSVCKNIASAIGAIKRMGHLSYVMFWSSFIIALSNLTLIIVLWCGETVTGALISEKLQRLQNRAASILMSAATYDSSLEDVFRALGCHELCHQRLEKKSIMMFKTLQGMTPEYLRSRFVYRLNASSYCLRNTEKKTSSSTTEPSFFKE